MKTPLVLRVGIATLFGFPAVTKAVNYNWIANPGTSDWNDPANWEGGILPVGGAGNNVFIHTPGSITGVAINLNQLLLSVGTSGAPASGFTFGAGTYTLGSVAVADGFNGTALNNAYGRAFIEAGTTINATNFFVGERSGATGHVIQNGGSMTLTGQFRVGHWPQAGGGASTYTLNGGDITVQGNPSDPFSEAQNGTVFLGIDSTGVFVVNGGTFTAKGIALDNRGATAGQDRLEVNGGTLNIGGNGLVSMNAADPTTYLVQLGGGTLAATANWTSPLAVTLTNTGASAINFNPNGNTITMSGVLSGAGGLNQAGAGTLLLTGANTYTGETAVNAGTLRIGTPASLGTGALSVSGGSLELTGKGTTVATQNVSSVSLASGAITFGVNGTVSDSITASGTITLGGTNVLNLAGLGSVIPGTTYTLLSGAAFSGAGNLALGATPAGFYTWTPNQTATQYQVTVTGLAAPAVAYWAGSVSSIWSDASVAPTSNWRTSAAGTTDTNQIPGATTDVFFATNTAANLTNTLGGNISINSLTVTAATTGDVSIGGNNTLSIGAGGITREAGAGALTLNPTSMVIVGAQTWTNQDTSKPITVGSSLTGSDAITTAGPGTIILGGGNSGYTGTLTVGAGTVQLAAATAAGATTSAIVVDGTLDLNGNSLTKADLSGGAGGVITSTAPGTMTVAAMTGTYAGVIQDGSGVVGLSKSGGGALTLAGNNAYSGPTIISAGRLNIGAGGATGAIGSGPITLTTELRFNTTNPNTIGSINAAAPAGTLYLTGDTPVTLAPGAAVKINSLQGGISGINDTLGGTLNIGPGTSLVVQGSASIGNTAGGGLESHTIFNQTGGTVDVNAANTDGRNFVLGHWNQGRGTYNQSAGTFNSPNISMSVSWDGNGTYNLSGGTANLRGLRFGHNAGRSGVFNLTGGELNLGVDGIWSQFAGLPNDINLGGGTIRASAAVVPITEPIELTGTNGDVVFDTNGNTLNVTGAITGGGGFIKNGAGRLVLDAPNSATGVFTVNAGTLALQGAQTVNRLPANAIVLVNAGATLEFGSTNPVPFTGNYFVTGGTLTNAAAVDHVHIGAAQLNGAVWTTDPASTSYNGENYELHGTVAVTGTAPSTITQQGGDASNRGVSWVGSVTFDVADVTASSAPDLIVTTELENADNGTAALVKAGAGSINLAFANSYTGGTSVNGGTLLANNLTGSATGSGAVNVAPGARIGGAGTIGDGGAVVVTMGGKLAPGNSAGTLTFNLGAGGVLDLSTGVADPGSAALEFELGANVAGSSDLVQVLTGGLNIGTGLELDDFSFTLLGGFGNGDYVLFDGNTTITGTLGAGVSGFIDPNYIGTLQLGDGGNDLVLHVVPEPGSAALLLGGLGLAALRRRRK